MRADWVRKSEEKRLILDLGRFLTDRKGFGVHFCEAAIVVILGAVMGIFGKPRGNWFY